MVIKVILFVVFLFFILFWMALGGLFIGYVPLETFAQLGLPTSLVNALQKIELPATTAALGDSMAVLDGLLSSIAIMLGLIAVLLQGRELKASNKAQNEQLRSFAHQLKIQKRSNEINAYATTIQSLQWDADRLEKVVGRLTEEIKNLSDPDKKAEVEKIKIKSIKRMQKRRKTIERIYEENLEPLIDSFNIER